MRRFWLLGFIVFFTVANSSPIVPAASAQVPMLPSAGQRVEADGIAP